MELKQYIEIILRRRWILFQSIITIVGCALLISFSSKPIYKTSANVLLKTEDFKAKYLSYGAISPLPPDLGTIGYVEQRNVVDTYIALAQNSTVLKKVIKELNLKDVKGRIIEVKDFVISVPRYPKLIFKQKKGVKIKRMKAAEMLEITGYSTNRQEAVKIANSVADAFSDSIADLWKKDLISVVKSIEKQLYQIQLFSYFADFWRKQKDNISNINETAVDADVDSQVSVLINEMVEMEVKKNDLQKNLENKIGNNNAVFLKKEISSISKQIDGMKEITCKLLKGSTNTPYFMNKLATLGEIHGYLKTRLEYLKIAQGIDVTNAITIQPAALNEYPNNDIYFPKKSSIAVMSLLLSIGFGIFLCFLLEYLDESVKTPQEIRDNLGLPLIGTVRMIDTKKMDTRELAGFHGDFWDIRSNLKMSGIDNSKILTITSAVKGEGKSTVSRSLAEIYVKSGKKVLLIDLNLRRPYLSKMLKQPNSPGLSDYLTGQAGIKKITLPMMEKEGSDFIPAGFSFANPLKILDSANMREFIQTISPHYDLIICDTPALEDGSDSAVISSYGNAVLFVAASGQVSRYGLKTGVEILRKSNANVLGIILNKAIK